MKTLIRSSNPLISFALALAAAGWLWGPAVNGLAGEKGATRLLHASAPKAAAACPTTVTPKPMAVSCPQCTESWTTVVEKTSKAVQPERRHVIPKHQCTGCSNATVITGHGKAKTKTIVHTCTSKAAQAGPCCTMK